MNEGRLRETLAGIEKVKVAVYGDFCVDVYWILDPRGSEVSVETGLRAQAVRRQTCSPGGASNIVANLAALAPASIQVVGVIGDDLFGRELVRQFEALGVDVTSLVVQKENFDTLAFGKPCLEGDELPRLDFGVFNRRTETTDDALITGLRRALETADAVVFNQQVPGSITHPSFIDKVGALFDEFADRIVLLDSRHYGHRFTRVYRKVNDLEAARLNHVDVKPSDVLALRDVRRHAERLYGESGKPVFVTRGPHGILVCDDEGLHEIPGIQLLRKLDPVGAGDTTVSALACCLAAELKPAEAAEFANFAAAVTVQKLFQTGTASGEEILEIARDPDYIYQPELARDLRQARRWQDSEIELCYEHATLPLGRVKQAVFDHDGTISTLRQGWETVMEPVMVRAILGEGYKTADPTLYHKVLARVRDYIDKSTGIQTILQMEALVEMVREFEVVPAGAILDKWGYKELYNDALMKTVNRRIARLKSGKLDVGDCTLKGATAFLGELCARGVRLYLVSGTDQADTRAEAEALGYAGLFDGGIEGALGDVREFSKKMVIERIMREHRLEGAELAVFGDGPVEMRECRKRGGLAVGVASNEVQRFGWNLEKRARLVTAGAHLIAPDFSQGKTLLSLLFADG